MEATSCYYFSCLMFIRLLLSVSLCPKVITISGGYFFYINLLTNTITKPIQNYFNYIFFNELKIKSHSAFPSI